LKTRIFYDGVKYRLRNSKRILKYIEKVIGNYRKPNGSLSFIFINDEEILNINKEFLKHDYYTDVIAFDYGSKNLLEGEIYLSIETIKANSINYKVSLRNEVLKVMIHGTLHLCGFKDSNMKERMSMKKLEDKWILKADKI
jgi:probable rRNA maturation factor